MNTDSICAVDGISGSFSLAVISDLHAFDKNNYDKKTYPSFLDMAVGEDNRRTQPITSLMYLIKKNELKADVIVCAGDMGDKANPSAIQYAWKKLQELKTIFNGRFIAATPGNHDHDSRSIYCKYDPRGALQSLSPKFPFANEHCFNEFWAKNYSIISNDIFRLVIFNSSAFHGISNERRHGRISPYTLDSLKTDLCKTSQSPINIFLCHHHPHKHEDLNLADYDMMEGGPSLLSTLGSGQFGSWIVIHGHKHFPKLSYAQGGTGGPIIFSAGSLCGFLQPEINTLVKNQFYLIEFDLDAIKRYGFVGKFRAWDWAHGQGWISASNNSGLPASGGFGLRAQIDLLSDEVAWLIDGAGKKEWEEVIKSIPKLQYLTPGDLDILEIHLNKRHSIKVIKSSEGLIMQIGKA